MAVHFFLVLCFHDAVQWRYDTWLHCHQQAGTHQFHLGADAAWGDECFVYDSDDELLPGIPNEIEEAAVIDGANQAQVLFRIYLPMSLPSLATIILFATVANWNVWMDGYMYMNTPDKYPLQTYLATILMESKTNVEALMTPEQLARLSQISQKTIEAAQIFLAALPIMCVYPFLQKYYIKGIVVGSVKG